MPEDRVPILLERRLSPALISRLIEAYSAGASTRDLARQHGVSESSVIKLLQRNGIPLRYRGSYPRR